MAADLKTLSSTEVDVIETLTVRALEESWTRATEIVVPCLSLALRNQALARYVDLAMQRWPDRKIEQDATDVLSLFFETRLLLCLLKVTVISDIALERFLTDVRAVLLKTFDQPRLDNSEAALSSVCAIAQQCFINEYVYALTPDEQEQATRTRTELISALEEDAPLPALQVAIIATYFPLHSLPNAERLLQFEWPAAMQELLVQQISEPKEEARLRHTIRPLTPIKGKVSNMVREQYEENPYPRWIKAPLVEGRNTIETLLHQTFPRATLKNRGHSAECNVLVAGCGTGQNPIQTAQLLPRAKVLALDLSLSSLSYAKRKTSSMGLTNLDYAQADIMELGQVADRFDVIESLGVLHHLAEPMQGWRILVSLLRPGGFMHLGFYSDIARQSITAGQFYIAERREESNVEDIRGRRQDLIATGPKAIVDDLLKLSDFYSTSECRDLLFHVQEHRMTLPQIKSFLAENNLTFIGFKIGRNISDAYQAMFPDDRAMLDLDLWHIFEQKHPATFIKMYQFWVQKSG